MIGYYNYTVILTYLSLISALLGIHWALDGKYVEALICLLLCGAFDSFDGMVARTKKGRTEAEKKFGIQIDSLVDMLSFGVFPIMIGYALGLKSWLWGIIFCIYAICAVSRLGYFNVAEEMRQKETSKKRKYYQGLPVTSTALILPSVYLLNYVLPLQTVTSIYGLVMACAAVAFVTDFQVVKPSFKGIISLVVVGAFVLIGLMFIP